MGGLSGGIIRRRFGTVEPHPDIQRIRVCLSKTGRERMAGGTATLSERLAAAPTDPRHTAEAARTIRAVIAHNCALKEA